MQARLGGADGNLEDGGSFLEGQVVLIAEQEDGPAGGRNLVDQGEESLVGWLSEAGVEESEVIQWCFLERLPTAGVFEMRESNSRGDAERPRAEYGGLKQVGELAEYLERSLLENVVGEGGARETGDIAAQGHIGVAKKLFQCGPIAGLRKKDQQGMAGFLELRRWRLSVHA